MDKTFEIRIGRASANDDTVTIQEWHTANGTFVHAGEILASLETSKAVLEVEAEKDGYLEILVGAGEVVGVGTLIGRLSFSGQRSLASDGNVHAQPHLQPASPPTVRYSKLALAMMAHHGIPTSALPQRGLIRKEDIQAYLDREMESNPAAGSPTVNSTAAVDEHPTADPRGATNATSAPSAGNATGGGLPSTKQSPVRFFSDARKSAADRGHGLVWLALNYFFRNYLLGHLARLSPLGVNLWIHRLRGVKMGKGVYIDPSATIETAYPENVTIGNDVRITANAIIMTHIKAPHALRNAGIVPLVNQPVVLEDHCFIGVNAVIMPGVTIGKGSVVTSGSVVLANVPAAVMVTGNPAKVVKRLTPIDNETSGL